MKREHAFVLLAAIAGCGRTPATDPVTEASLTPAAASLSIPAHCAACSNTLSGAINTPADDAVHPYTDYSMEWFYYATHLVTDDGQEFGFTQIFYNLQNTQDTPPTPLVYVDSAISDLGNGAFHFGGRQFSPDAPAIVASSFSLSVGTETASGGNGRDSVHSEVTDGDNSYVVDLQLKSIKTPVFHIADGYINYYSRERMVATGTLRINGVEHSVYGNTWFDHQFGPQQIELATVQNWTWLALQLSDNREVFVLVVNRTDGTQSFYGSYSDASCKTTQLAEGDFTLTATDSWSANDSCTYPSGWDVSVPSKHVKVHVAPRIQNQDIWVPGLDHYYEGDASVHGSSLGKGYVELFGFCAP